MLRRRKNQEQNEEEEDGKEEEQPTTATTEEIEGFDTYLDLLPKGIREFPILFNEGELNYLAGCSCNPWLTARKDLFAELYSELAKEVDGYKKRFKRKEFVEVISLIYDRFFNLDVGGESLLCGVPYADLFGHSGQSQTTWYYH